jgi:hypothetical protein
MERRLGPRIPRSFLRRKPPFPPPRLRLDLWETPHAVMKPPLQYVT